MTFEKHERNQANDGWRDRDGVDLHGGFHRMTTRYLGYFVVRGFDNLTHGALGRVRMTSSPGHSRNGKNRPKAMFKSLRRTILKDRWISI